MVTVPKLEPREILHKLRDEVDQGFEEVIGLTPTGLTSSVTHWRPRVDVYETDTHFIIECDLPGVAPDGIQLTLTGRSLTLKAKPRTAPEDEKRSYLRRERYHREWKRIMDLNGDVDLEAIEARSEHGVLTVRLPKLCPKDSMVRQIPVV